MDTIDDSVTTRFRQLRERAGMSMDELARAMGYARASSIQRYENADQYQKEFIAPELVLKMIKAVVGKGEPPIKAAEVWRLARPEVVGSHLHLVDSFAPEDDEEAQAAEALAYSREHWRPAMDGALPEVDMKLGAGSGAVGEVINLPVGEGQISGHRVVAEWFIPLEYLRNEAKASPKSTVVSEIIGDSMSPTYMPGDRVLIDLSQNRMVSDSVYAISDGFSEPQIKRLQRVPFSNPAQVIIISDNPTLERFTVELEKLIVIGRICGRLSRQ